MIPLPDLRDVVAIAAASAATATLAGWLALRLLRRRALVASLLVVGLVPVVSVALGALSTATAMFFNDHDLRVLLTVLAVSTVAALVPALLLGRGVARRSAALGEAVRDLGTTGSVGVPPPTGGVAELRRLDAELRDTADRLAASRRREQALEASRRELVAWVSHDLRTPLSGIRAMAEALEDGVVSDEVTVARYHHGIRHEADRLAAMVDDLFELSRINASALHLTLQEVSLADLVSDAIASAAPVAQARGVHLVGAADDDLPPVSVSVPELGRVLRNLLSNAIRHTPADGVVQVRATWGADGALVEVADGCGGIPLEDLPRVFEVAFRGSAARTPDDSSGAGLGLAIARGLVEAHEGEISIRNEGPGCTVQVRLPAAV